MQICTDLWNKIQCCKKQKSEFLKKCVMSVIHKKNSINLKTKWSIIIFKLSGDRQIPNNIKTYNFPSHNTSIPRLHSNSVKSIPIVWISEVEVIWWRMSSVHKQMTKTGNWNDILFGYPSGAPILQKASFKDIYQNPLKT